MKGAITAVAGVCAARLRVEYRGVFFSFLYLAVRALLGLLVRSRRGPDVKDVELLVLRHELEVLRRQARRPNVQRVDRALLAAGLAICPRLLGCRCSSRRGRSCGGTARLCDGSGGSQARDRGGRGFRRRSGSLCCVSRGRIRAGGIGGSAVSWPSLASKRHRRASAACSPGPGWVPPRDARLGAELARVHPSPGREHRRARFPHGRDTVPALLLHAGLHRARQPSDPARGRHDEPGRRLDRPAGSQAALHRPASANPLPDPRPRRPKSTAATDSAASSTNTTEPPREPRHD